MGKEVGLHQVRSGQVFIGGINPDQVFPGQVHEDRQPGAHAHVDGVKTLLGHQFFYGLGPADDRVADDLTAQLLQNVDLGLDDGLGQPEFRNTIDQDPAGFMKGFKDGYVMPFEDQVPGHGEPGGAGPDNGNLFAGGFGLVGQFEFPLGPLIV